MAKKQKFLFVLTSHGELGDTGEKTGFHFQEMSDPYYILQEHGIEVDLASIKGGEPPADPKSEKDKAESVQRFQKDKDAMAKLQATKKIDQINISDYAGIYLPGGHGTMWDFPDNKALQKAIEQAWADKKVVAAVCHGPAGFVNVKDKEGNPFFKNRRINSFTDAEEQAAKKDKIVPFLLQSKLKNLGGLFETTDPGQAIVVEDSNLITGQNPPSAALVANGILRTLGISPFTQAKNAAA